MVLVAAVLKQKQEVLIVLDDSKPPEDPSVERSNQTAVTPTMSPSQCLLDLDIEANQVPEDDSQSKAALLNHSLHDAQVLDRKLPFDVQTASLESFNEGGVQSDTMCVRACARICSKVYTMCDWVFFLHFFFKLFESLVNLTHSKCLLVLV